MRDVPDHEREHAVALAQDAFVAGELTVDELEAQTEAALRGLVDGTCLYLSPFPPPRDPTKPERR